MSKTAIEQAIDACKELGEKSHYAELCIGVMKAFLPVEKELSSKITFT